VSGGVDSTVVLALLNKVLGQEKVLGLHVDSGLMRQGESADILEYMKKNGFENLQIYDASVDFLSALAGVFEPEKKREIIGNMFMEIKTKAQEKLGLNENEWLIAQGTIYPDVIETGNKNASKVKTHHNRVDLVVDLIEKGLVIEPLASLYKDEVRKLGEYLGIPKDLVWRHPFPGPGLGVRCLCSNEKSSEETNEITGKSVDLFGYEAKILPVSSVGVKNGERTYAYPTALFGDYNRDYNYEHLIDISNYITSKAEEINRVVFSIFCECDDRKYSTIEAYCTKDRLDKLRAIDKIANNAIIASGEYEKIWQMPVVLLPLVNSKGNETIVLRPINSSDAMTAKVYDLPLSVFEEIVKKSREIEGIGDIFVDITPKPPGTIEWE
jgi:GMP synthase (glutamine-hydrolysing)